MKSTETALMPSLLDRLVDACYARQPGRVWYDERELIASVERDVEELLNSRQTMLGLEAFPELQKSILGFGLPDANIFDLETPQSRHRFARTIEALIDEFEPRVDEVQVSMLEEAEVLNSLQFQIIAKLKIESAPTLTFETTLQLSTGQYEINSANSNPG